MMPINRPNFLIRASYILMVMLAADGYIGITWGRMATQRMIPSMVVDMMLQNNIRYVKTFSASKNVLEAFGGTGIQVDISLPNSDMKTVNTSSDADLWIATHIKAYQELNVTFRHVFVGISPLSIVLPEYIHRKALSTLDLVQRSLETNNVTGVKATFSHGTWELLVLPNEKPSMAEIKPEVKEQIIEYCKIIERSNAPFCVEIYPYGTPINSKNDTEFDFFENNSTSKFWDGEFFYNNSFEVLYDSIVVALEKIGFPDLPLLVGSIGWPTDGKVDANPQCAERFHQGLVKFIMSKKGTPRHPGNIDVYIHSIADENAVSAKAGPFMRHWGIYKFDGQPKFNLDFTGKGREVKPVSAVGISHMPMRWCVLDTSKINPKHIPFETLDAFYNSTCTVGDCTTMSPGGSCSGLSFPMNYSYAFNAGFQSNKQNVRGNNSCDYGGYGILVLDDPSTSSCKFPVEIIAAETVNTLGQIQSFRISFAPSTFPVFNFMFILTIYVLYRDS